MSFFLYEAVRGYSGAAASQNTTLRLQNFRVLQDYGFMVKAPGRSNPTEIENPGCELGGTVPSLTESVLRS